MGSQATISPRKLNQGLDRGLWPGVDSGGDYSKENRLDTETHELISALPGYGGVMLELNQNSAAGAESVFLKRRICRTSIRELGKLERKEH